MILIVLIQCKKEENEFMVIKGVVKDARSGEGAPNIDVDFLIQGVVNGTFNNNYRRVSSTTTDGNGSYRLEFEEGTPSSFRFEMEGPGFYFSQQDFNPDEFSGSEENILDLNINSQAWLKWRIVNEENAFNGDQINFTLNVESNECSNCCQSELYSFGGLVDETFVCEAYGNSAVSAEGTALDIIFGDVPIFVETVLVPQDTTEMVIAF